jgi:hypothetical protein
MPVCVLVIQYLKRFAKLRQWKQITSTEWDTKLPSGSLALEQN